MPIHVIGITGPSGSGKSMFSQLLQRYHIPCVDADSLYHSMLIPPSPCLDRIAQVFGNEVLCADGSLNRNVLSSIVFQKPCELQKLNQTVLPMVIDQINNIIADAEARGELYIAVDAPTLIESGFYRQCQTKIVIIADDQIRIQRIMQRDGISEQKAAERISAQQPLSFYTSVADHVIENNASSEEFFRNAENILKIILQPE